MSQRQMYTVCLVVLLLPSALYAGDHKESKTMPIVKNTVYTKNCGTCHFAYQPDLLPARAWVKIINSPGGHAGGDLSLESNEKSEIERYLRQNSAEQSPSKRSKKILSSLGSDTPVRISEIPYIKKKHREISQDVFMRKAIGSRANCVACHRSAASGVYEDDDVVIPN